VTLIELCAGTASVSLWALGRCKPLVGYMGSKRADASLLCALLDVDRKAPDRVVLVDAGPWGDTWSTLSTKGGRDHVCRILRAWDERGELPDITTASRTAARVFILTAIASPLFWPFYAPALVYAVAGLHGRRAGVFVGALALLVGGPGWLALVALLALLPVRR